MSWVKNASWKTGAYDHFGHIDRSTESLTEHRNSGIHEGPDPCGFDHLFAMKLLTLNVAWETF